MREKQYSTIGDVARETEMTVQKIRKLCELGRLPAVNTSTTDTPRWTIRRAGLDAFLTPTSVQQTQSEGSL